jgi:hypothetical protein
MKKDNSNAVIILILFLLSMLVYTVQIIVFDAPRDTGFYLLQDLAFLPIQIAIVTIVLGKYLKNREKAERLKKINVVISAFFSEAGTDILMILTSFSRNCDELRAKLDVQIDWTDSVFSKTVKFLEKADIQIECSAVKLGSLKALMKSKRGFLIRIIENPNLFEHDSFTDTLLSVYHVMEELIARSELEEAGGADIAHISNDVKRALKALLIQWVEYMRHLHAEYPYLYSLEIRKNPFLKDRSVTISD